MPKVRIQGPCGSDQGTTELRAFNPTPKDIILIRSMLPLPPELVTQILDLAECWAYFRAERYTPTRFYDANDRYLQSGPVEGGEFAHPLRRLVITTDSSDFSRASRLSLPWFGKSEDSWTWFELTLDDGKTGDEIVRVELINNICLGFWRITIEDEGILKQAKEGDWLSVWVRSQSPNWCMDVKLVRIERWVAC